MMNLSQLIDYYISQGFCIIPVKPDDKSPVIKWRNAECASAEQVLKWIAQGFNIAVICGAKSDNLAVIDCDTQEIYEKLFDKDIEKETLVVRTGLRKDPPNTRGHHVYIKVGSTFRTRHYAQQGLKLDIQCEGAIVVLPPSRHPSGVQYELAKDRPPLVKSWAGDFEYDLTELLKSKLDFKVEHRSIDIAQLMKGVRHGQRDVAAIQLASYYRQEGYDEEETLEKLREWDKRNRDERGAHPDRLGEEILAQKVCSAFKPKEPYHYRFKEGINRRWLEVGEPISFNEWREVITKNFPKLWPYAEACASTATILLIKDALPFALILQGVPGCGKTTTLSFFYDFLHSHKTDKFTPASFVSHAPQKTEKELEKVDLLPKLKHKILITSDLSPLFGLIPERLKENLSTLTRVLDGRGLVTESGIHGTRGYSGDYMFTWVAATTPIPYAVWDLFGNLGARMYFYEVGTERKTVDEHVQELRRTTYRHRVRECNQATLRFLKNVWQTGEVEWNPEKDHEKILRRIVELALLLVRLRGKVNVVYKENYEGEKTYFSTPTIEHADRARQALYNLARGHAIIKGRKQLTLVDLPVVIEVTLSSAPYDRVNAFKYLLTKGTVTTADLMRDLKCSRRTAIRSMKTLEILDLVELKKTPVETEIGTRTGYTMSLKDEFKWFTSDEFKKLWHAKKIAPMQVELSERTEIVERLESFNDIFKEGENKVDG